MDFSGTSGWEYEVIGNISYYFTKNKREENIMADENMLVDSKAYLKSGIHIGTKFRTKQMAGFIKHFYIFHLIFSWP